MFFLLIPVNYQLFVVEPSLKWRGRKENVRNKNKNGQGRDYLAKWLNLS